MKGAVKVFNAISIILLVILIFWFTQIDYNNLTFSENVSPFFGIISIIFMVFTLQLIKNQLNKKK